MFYSTNGIDWAIETFKSIDFRPRFLFMHKNNTPSVF